LGTSTRFTFRRPSSFWISARFSFSRNAENVDRHLHVNRAGVFLHGLFLHDAQDVQRGGLGAADEAGAAAARAVDMGGFFQRRLQALAGKLHQAEARDLADLHPRAVELAALRAGRFSTSRWLRCDSMSMKSMTIRPPRSRSRAGGRLRRPPPGWCEAPSPRCRRPWWRAPS
jgi:hypothetical protein